MDLIIPVLLLYHGGQHPILFPERFKQTACEGVVRSMHCLRLIWKIQRGVLKIGVLVAVLRTESE